MQKKKKGDNNNNIVNLLLQLSNVSINDPLLQF